VVRDDRTTVQEKGRMGMILALVEGLFIVGPMILIPFLFLVILGSVVHAFILEIWGRRKR
jgi:hypothetical protein